MVTRGFHDELTRLDARLATLAPGRAGGASGASSTTQYAYTLYHRAVLTNREEDFDRLAATVTRGVTRFGSWPDLCLLQAQLHYRFHRIPEVRPTLERVPGLDRSGQGQTLLADVDLHEGRYTEARDGYLQALATERTWDVLARMAEWAAVTGDLDGADALYAEAADEVTAKEMRAFAWIELHRGLLRLGRGDYQRAGEHYATARQAYPGYWRTDEYRAELLAARGEEPAAVALFRSVAERAPRPELDRAIGDLHLRLGDPEGARYWHDRAHSGFLASTGRGEVHYFHHLAEFHADVRGDGVEALRWARRDAALRPNHVTQATLAWAAHRAGKTDVALRAVTEALSSGARSAVLLRRAAQIHAAAGSAERAAGFEADSRLVDPRPEDFRMAR